MAAYTQYLWEDYLRNSDVGQAAILEAEKEEVEHKKLLAENDRVSIAHWKHTGFRFQVTKFQILVGEKIFLFRF